MSSAVRVYSPRVVRARVGPQDQANSVTAIYVSVGINQPLSVQVSLQPPLKNKNTGILSADEALTGYSALAGGAQSYIRSRDLRTGPDLDLDIDTGQGPLKVRGYLTEVGTVVGYGGGGWDAGAGGLDHPLDLIDFSLFRSVNTLTFVGKDGYWYGALGKDVLSWSQFVRSVIKAVTKVDRVDLTSDPYRRLTKQQDLDRTLWALPFLDKIIAQSQTPLLDEVLAQGEGLGFPDPKAMGSWLAQTAVATGKGLGSQWLLALAANFGLEYIPQLNGPGKLVESAYLLDQSPRSVEVRARDLHTSSSFASVMPVNRVVVTVPTRTTLTEGLGLPSQVSGIAGVWPEDAPTFAGSAQEIAPPQWAQELMSTPPPVVQTSGMNLKALVEWRDSRRAHMLTTTEHQARIMQWWARNAYRWMSVSDSTASLSGIPLDPSYAVGERLQVVVDGKEILTGTVQRVQHVLALDAENPQAHTEVNLTHCLFSGFVPPGWS